MTGQRIDDTTEARGNVFRLYSIVSRKGTAPLKKCQKCTFKIRQCINWTLISQLHSFTDAYRFSTLFSEKHFDPVAPKELQFLQIQWEEEVVLLFKNLFRFFQKVIQVPFWMKKNSWKMKFFHCLPKGTWKNFWKFSSFGGNERIFFLGTLVELQDLSEVGHCIHISHACKIARLDLGGYSRPPHMNNGGMRCTDSKWCWRDEKLTSFQLLWGIVVLLQWNFLDKIFVEREKIIITAGLKIFNRNLLSIPPLSSVCRRRRGAATC